MLLTAIALGIFYYYNSSSSQTLLNEITFTDLLGVTFGNGIPSDQLWPGPFSIDPKAVLAKLKGIRTFLAVTNWALAVITITHPTLPYYFTLTETALSVKTYIAAQSGIHYTGSDNDLVGFLLTPTQVAFKYAVNGVITVPEKLFTGNDVLAGHGLQDLAVIIIYTVS